MATEERPIKGRARLEISDDLVRLAGIKVEKPRTGEIIWGLMEVKELFDLFAAFLLLPEHFTILGVYFEAAMYQWVLVVESAELPIPEPNMMIPYLHCNYQRTDDGKVRLIDYQVGR